MSNKIDNVGIIVSSGRTGTRFLAEYFDKNYEDVVAFHEPKPSYALRRYTNAYMLGKVSDEKMSTLLQRKRKKLMTSLKAHTYIESNPYLHGFIPVLDSVWADPKIIHIIRDPRTFVVSALNYKDSRVIKTLANKWIPNWLPNVRHLLNISGEMSPFGFYAGCWRVVNESILRSAQEKSSYRLFLYEDLFADDFAGLKQLCDVFSLDFSTSKGSVSPNVRINQSASSSIADWSTWAPARCAEVDKICSPLMQEYGYGLDQPWLDRVEQGKT